MKPALDAHAFAVRGTVTLARPRKCSCGRPAAFLVVKRDARLGARPYYRKHACEAHARRAVSVCPADRTVEVFAHAVQS